MKKPELKGIAVILLIALVLGTVLAGISGKLEQWGLPWFTGAKMTDKIVFVSNRSGPNEIYAMNLDGSKQEQLTNGAKVLSAPAIPASGTKIAFIGMFNGASQVMTIGASGGSPQPLTASEGPKRQPGYSPNGKKLTYIDSGRVYVAELNGSNPEPVLPNHAELVGAIGDPMGRGSIPRYSAYTWGPDSEAMAGISSPDRITDALTYIPSQEGELQKILPPNPGTKVNALAFAADKLMLAASVDLGQQRLVLVYEPGSQGPRPVLALPKVSFGALALSPDGSNLLVQMISPSGKPEAGLIKVDLTSGRGGMLVKGQFERLSYSPKGDMVLATQRDTKANTRSVVAIDPESGRITKLATKGDCFDAVFSPASEK